MKYKVLINKENKIKKNYINKITLIDIKNRNGIDIKIEKETYENYQNLKEFLCKKNIEIDIESAYSPLDSDNDYTNEDHTGLAIHIIVDGNIEETQKYLHEYGFILRYPKDKEKATYHKYDPFHIRYVGKIVAKIIYENNFTLEEYLSTFSGVLLVNKEKNMTSFDVVKRISDIYGIKRIGHTGTLDPLAEGLLIITIGQATKIAELLTATYKEYEAGVILGIKTDTLDITGRVLDTKSFDENIDIEKVLKSFNKTYLQEVPIYSAVKINGKKLYEYARKNESVQLPKKEVTIKNTELLNTDKATFNFRCTVSKGCYIRSLINDIGLSMNTYATMTKLTRTKQGKFHLKDAYTLLEIEKGEAKLLSIEQALDYPVIVVDHILEYKIRNGQPVKNDWNIEEKVIFKNEIEKILGIYEVVENTLKTWKNFN